VAAALPYCDTARFALDFWRARDGRGADARYAILTPAQWLCLVLLAVGLAFLARARQAILRDDVPRYDQGLGDMAA
jgi:prolipoprotein diacylglyceryltransferase